MSANVNKLMNHLNQIRISKIKDDSLKDNKKIKRPNNPLKKWNNPKQQNVMLSQLYKETGLVKHAHRVLECGQVLQFITDVNGRHAMLTGIYSCKERFCPICQKIRSRKDQRALVTELNYLTNQRTKSGNPKYNLVFLTLTIPNVKLLTKGHKLAKKNGKRVRYSYDLINKYVHNFLYSLDMKGWGKYSSSNKVPKKLKGKKCKGRVLGAILKHEYTVNKKDVSINTHVHLILIMHGSYYHSRYYLNQKQWSKLYDQATGHHYVLYVEAPFYTIKKMTKVGVRLKKVTINGCYSVYQINECLNHMTKELSKYETKSTDFVSILNSHKKKYYSRDLTLLVFQALYFGLRHTLEYTYYGKFRRIHHNLLIGKLDKYSPQQEDNTYYDLNLNGSYSFQNKKYNHKYSKMTDEDKLAVRYKYGVKTTYTTDEKHMNFNDDEDYVASKKRLKKAEYRDLLKQFGQIKNPHAVTVTDDYGRIVYSFANYKTYEKFCHHKSLEKELFRKENSHSADFTQIEGNDYVIQKKFGEVDF